MIHRLRLCALISAALGVLAAAGAQTVTLGGTAFTNKGLVGVGRVGAAQKDKFGETFGSLSGLALDLRTVTRNASGSSYGATLYAQPDRSITKSGAAINYRPRRHKLSLSFNPDNSGSLRQDQLTLNLSDTILYAESDGTPLTSLDPATTATGTRAGFPKLPQAVNGRISLDCEGLVLLPDGSFFVSDEYGPYLYRFAADGTLLSAIRPPEALIPKRNNQDSFSSDNAAAGQPAVSPAQPTSGRANNKGIEGLSVSADGRTLYAFMQAATRQDDGGNSNGQNRFARLLAYTIANPAAATLTGEWVLPLPLYADSSNAQQVADAHEIIALSATKFLVAASDGVGRGNNPANSRYRAVLVYDTAAATNIAGTSVDNASTPLAPNGILASNIVAATSVVLIDMNDTVQLAKFSLNNNANDNSDTLAGKWESLALLPALDAVAPDDFFLLVGNDNDFSTNSGFLDGAAYSSSPNIDTMVLAYRVTLPGTSYAPIFTVQPASRSAGLGQSVTLAAAATGNPAPTFQWSKDGAAISGATDATLAISAAQLGDSGAYTVVATNSAGAISSAVATLTVAVVNAPVISTQPAAQTVLAGSTVVFSVNATGTPAPGYQWRRDGLNISGATGPTLVLSGTSGATASLAGSYSAVATNTAGVATSTPAALTIATTGDSGRLINLSVLTDIAAGSSFTVGTVIGGAGTSGNKALVVRAVGPSLGALGVPGTIGDPQLTLFNGSSVAIAANDNWGSDSSNVAALTNAMASVGAFAFTGPTSKDAAVFQSSLTPGNYSVQVSGVSGSVGTAIAEIYDATPAGTFTAASSRLVNVSVLKSIPSGGLLTLGFTVGGSVAKTVLIRVIGPGLAAVGVTTGTLGDPQLTLFNGSSATIAANDDWGADSQLTNVGARVNAFAIGSNPSKDAMLLITLPPGGYTARATGNAGTSGLAIVEVYEVP